MNLKIFSALLISMFVLFLGSSAFAAAPTVTAVTPTGQELWNAQTINIHYDVDDSDNNADAPNKVDCNIYWSPDGNYEVALTNGTLTTLVSNFDLNTGGNCDSNGTAAALDASCYGSYAIPESTRDISRYFIVRCASNGDNAWGASAEENRIVETLQDEYNSISGLFFYLILAMVAGLAMMVIPDTRIKVIGLILIVLIVAVMLIPLMT